MGDGELHYVRSDGGGQSVVFLHGLMGSGATWLPTTHDLDAELDLIAPDARGHGDSSAPGKEPSYHDLAEDVAELIAHLELRRPVLVGHSMGGMTATVAAAHHCAGRLRALVLVDPTFISAELQEEVWASDVADQHRSALVESKETLLAEALTRHPRRDPAVVELQVAARLKTRLSAFGVLRPPNPDYRALIRSIDVPILLVIGDTPVVSPDVAHELSELNPIVRVEQIAAAGHGLPFDQPEQLAASITSFLDGLATTLPD